MFKIIILSKKKKITNWMHFKIQIQINNKTNCYIINFIIKTLLFGNILKNFEANIKIVKSINNLKRVIKL